jgi:hypothetical protein
VAAGTEVANKRYLGFDEFLKEAIREYYQRSFRGHKATFVALLVSSGQALNLAKDKLTAGGTEQTMKKAALGAGAVVALRIGLGFALSGPLGVLLTAGTAASLIYYAARNQDEIAQKHSRVKAVVADVRAQYERLQGKFGGSQVDESQRNLMIDGLLQRMMTDLDAA